MSQPPPDMPAAPAMPQAPEPDQRHIVVPLARQSLHGTMVLPDGPLRGLILFVSPCAAAGPDEEPEDPGEQLAILQDAGFATLRIELLRTEHCRCSTNCTALPALEERLLAVIGHLRRQMAIESLPRLPLGIVAAGKLSPLAVRAAARRDDDVRALVCLGGLIDVAGRQFLELLRAPLLFIGDAGNATALTNAQGAIHHLAGKSRIEILDTEDRALHRQRKAGLLRDWFQQHL